MECEERAFVVPGLGSWFDATPQWSWAEGEDMVFVRGVFRGPGEANTEDAFSLLLFLYRPYVLTGFVLETRR